ncbi:MAG: HDIG domain-containing protein [Deltaproteobacteria bacterium]|nr:HDIG domain-containing protein [Deltaproteobacteria bacterium]
MDNSQPRPVRDSVFGVWKKEDFRSWKGFFNSPFLGWLAFLIGCFLVTLLLSFQIQHLPSNARVGLVAQKDIKADQSYEIIDERSTEKNREEAQRSVLPVYDFNPSVGAGLDLKIQEAFEKSRQILSQKTHVSRSDFKEVFSKILGFDLSEEEISFLEQNRFKSELEDFFHNIIRQAFLAYIVDDTNSLEQNDTHFGIVIRKIVSTEENQEFIEKKVESIISTEDVQKKIREQVKNLLWDEPFKGASSEQVEKFLLRFIRSNLSYNAAETQARRDKAAATVKPVIIKIQVGESIIRSGDRFEAWHLVVLEGIQDQKRQTNMPLKFVGTFLFVALLLLVTYSFAARFIRKFQPSKIDLIFLGSNLILSLVFVRLVAVFAGPIRETLNIELDLQTLYYTIPLAAGAMLTRLVLNSETAIIFALISSTLAGFFLKSDIDLSIFFLISSIAGAGSIVHVDRRSTILKAGLYTGIINAFAIFTIKMVQVVSVMEHWTMSELTGGMLAGFLGGTNSALYVLFYMPLVEMIFGYTTDIKLLELGSLNHPLMREMIVKAPGTYHHSQLVAVLAEAAAQAIGANPILARVGAYFHDIGKIVKPLYFIENQMGGTNRHEGLKPSMSALILCSHVKEGLELARQYKLPKVVADMIPQHQGTKVIRYFYNKAKEQEQSDLHVVEQEDYRYPGPRPQSREAGILLLADGVEAAVRSLSDKSPAKIQDMVQKIINKGFAEEQLDECDLTLNDLRNIANTFVRTLVGIYHQRVVYPNMEENNTIPLPLKRVESAR